MMRGSGNRFLIGYLLAGVLLTNLGDGVTSFSLDQQQRRRKQHQPARFSWPSPSSRTSAAHKDGENPPNALSSGHTLWASATAWLAAAAIFSLSAQPSMAHDSYSAPLELKTKPTTIKTTSTIALAESTTSSSSTRQDIESARNTLQVLLDNWEKAIIDCTYADVPRELLEQRNKELLLEKASTFALFDKSVAVISCKTNNRIVRDYLGATGKGPVVGVEKKLRQGLAWVRNDDDAMDDYVQTVELVEQALAKAKSFSYTAGVADLNSVNNFAQAEKALVLVEGVDSNLEQARQSIVQVVQGLEKILDMMMMMTMISSLG